jgi:hypothetical protein
MQPVGIELRRHGKMRWDFALPAFFMLACLLPAAPSQAEHPPDPRELLRQLNSARVDRTQVYAIREGRIIRDRMTLYFNRGFIAFLTKTNGEYTGAVFSGEGEILMIPPNPVEKRNLAQFTHAPVLEEAFESAYLCFSDQTARELLEASRKPDPDDPEQPDQFVELWSAAVQQRDTEISARILTDLLGDRSRPYFFARVESQSLGVLEITDDERLTEGFSIVSVRKVESQVFTDVWCSFPTKAYEARAASEQDSVRPVSYSLDIRIHPDHSLEGRAEVEIESRSATDRVLSFGLSRWLAVTGVEDDQGRSLVTIDNPPGGGSPPDDRPYDHFEVVLPQPRPVGQRFRLIFKYHGNVIVGVGNGVLYVGARGSWYPNLDLGYATPYDLTFHFPEKLVLVATGTRVEEKSSEGWLESRWRSDGVFRVAGFNLGPYISVERQAGKTRVTVYATREAESSLERRRPLAVTVPTARLPEARRGEVTTDTMVPKIPEPLAPSALLDNVAQIAADAVQYFSGLFGPFPYPHLALSQVPGSFGQGWPELVYLPTLSFLPKADRFELSPSKGGSDPLGPVIIAHEVAHQWWGNLLGWETYHDQWLSEGLASYAAALFLARQKDGDRQFRGLLLSYKADLLAKTNEGKTVESGGPIWLGQRLSTSVDPQGYPNIVYKKACWVLHMLRMMMIDPKTGSDERFLGMLRDFISKYRGQSVSTEDFIHHVEKYMTPETDLERAHNLDWFFNEWVYQTGVPTYRMQTDIRQLAADKFLVQGSIAQSDVSEDFEMLVPVVAIYANKRVRLGRVAVSENGAHFKFTLPRKPTRVTIDEESLLAVVR